MHPFLLQIGSFTLPSYGVMIMLGVITCVWMALRRARSLGINPDHIYDLAFWSLISGFLGARFLFIIVNFRDFLADPVSMIFSRSGFVFLGGLLGAIPVVFYVIKKKNLEKWDVGDIAGPSVLLAHAFGRIGCFLAGCCYGGVCPPDSPLSFLAIRFPVFRNEAGEVEYSMSFYEHHEAGLIDALANHSAPVYPSQLFESFANLFIMFVLLFVWRRRGFQGQIFALYLMLYGVVRFLLEYVRGDAERGIYLGMSTSQYIALGLITAGAIIYALRKNKPIVLASATAPVEPSPEPAESPKRNSSKQGRGKSARRQG